MAEKKNARAAKKQLGQFMTPDDLVQHLWLTFSLTVSRNSRVFEPSLGKGAFVFAAIDALMEAYPSEMSDTEKLTAILSDNIYGCELDSTLFAAFKDAFRAKYGIDLDLMQHNFVLGDFFTYEPPVAFDLVIGNPPFGGTFDPTLEDNLDKTFGFRGGHKIKKETYAFFTVACLDMLAEGGELAFILSDTFLTINTMQGLRRLLVDAGAVSVTSLDSFSEETDYGMVMLHVDTADSEEYITVNGARLKTESIELTSNYSWNLDEKLVEYFTGDTVGDYLLCSSGMTIGKNELFLRTIDLPTATIKEPWDFSFTQEPITLAEERSKARLGKIGDKKEKEIRQAEARGDTYKKLQWKLKNSPATVSLPHKDYCFYNKAVDAIFYAAPTTAVFWRNNGEAVYTFKKNGAWYLHGVGGKSFFKREGITWNLISTKIKARYLPSGYILDSGAPVGVLREGVDRDELWLLLGWLNTELATRLLKTVINHTKNIQGKDIERMPYPFWMAPAQRNKAIKRVQSIVANLRAGNEISSHDMAELEKLYKKPA